MTKAGAPIAGTTLLAHAVTLLRERCGEVVVVAHRDTELPPVDAPVVRDRPGPRAAMTGLATGLAAVAGDDVLVLACDLPLAGSLLDRITAVPPGRAAVGDDGGAQPLCARYPRALALRECEERLAAGRLAMRDLAGALGAVPVAARGGELLNVNGPEDLRRADRALRGLAEDRRDGVCET